MVANNTQRKGKRLWTAAGQGEPLTVYSAFDAENEALFIADSIERLLAQDPGNRAAILYRTNAQSRPIEEALRRYNRKYAVVGGFSFYQRAEVKDVMAYLKLAVSQRDSISLLRVINTPARGIGKTTVEQLDQHARTRGQALWEALCELIDKGEFGARAQSALAGFRKLIEELAEAARTKPVDEVVRQIIERSGYREMLEREDTPESRGRLENLEEVATAAANAAERGETLGDFLDHAALVSDADSVDERAQVSLLTVHNAKGLEFPIVFLAGLEENLFPHSRSIGSAEAIEEERRLCYVGMTRAERRLCLSWARYRRRYGGGEQERTVASRFLKEIPRELVDDVEAGAVAGQVDLTAERWQVRQSVKKNTYTGKTHNSLENIQQFFGERGVPFAVPAKAPATVPPKPAAAPPPRAAVAPLPKAPGPAKRKFGPGSTVEHPIYGSGIVLRREGDGEDAKITVSFPKHGLKKLVEKYAGLKKS